MSRRVAVLAAAVALAAADVAGAAAPRFVRNIATGETGWFSSPALVDVTGDRRLEIARGAPETYASEVVAADLEGGPRPELVFGTHGAAPRSGRLVVLSARGRRLHEVRLRNQRGNGNGIGIAAAPSIADLDRDGRLEIVVSTFDHGLDVYRVPRSNAKRLPWPTGRGGLLRGGT